MGRAVVGVQFRRQRAMDRSQLQDRPEDEREAPDQSGKEDAEGGGQPNSGAQDLQANPCPNLSIARCWSAQSRSIFSRSLDSAEASASKKPLQGTFLRRSVR